jgi:hypothetical protein
MPHSTILRCLACNEPIVGTNQASQFLIREQMDYAGETRIEPRPKYSHADHAELAMALGYAPTGRVGVLNVLRDTWAPTKPPPGA